jgi:hypothetical protein
MHTVPSNQIAYLPPSTYCLTSLKELNLSNNKLQFLLAIITRLSTSCLESVSQALLRLRNGSLCPPSRSLNLALSFAVQRLASMFSFLVTRSQNVRGIWCRWHLQPAHYYYRRDLSPGEAARPLGSFARRLSELCRLARQIIHCNSP